MLGGDVLPRIPAEPPRSVDLLPGLRLSRAVSGPKPNLATGFLAFFCALMPVIIFLSDEDAMLSVRRTETAAGRVERTQPETFTIA